MRRWGIAAVVASACSFSPSSPNNGDGSVIDASQGTDARDGGSGSQMQAACLSNGAYAATGANGHRYRRVDGGSDRDAAYDECTADGAYLAEIADNAETAIVATLGANNAWIGLDDTVSERAFRWVNGSTSGYRNFQSGEPNDGSAAGRGEDCVTIGGDASHEWNDTPCGDPHPAVCECDATYVPPPTPACRTQAGWTAVQGRRYKHVTVSAHWQEAEADCETSGAYLIVPSDLDENNRIDGELGVTTRVWIGLRRSSTADFAPVDGEPVGLVNFDGNGSGKPMGGSGTDCIVVVNPGGKWENHTCEIDSNQYVCECDPARPQPPS